MTAWETSLAEIYIPDCLVLSIPEGVAGLPRSVATKSPSGEIVAYHCTGTTCSPPISTLAELLERLGRDPGKANTSHPV
jgi:hypothetical protein